MSRITGSDAQKMFEAYAAVYASQEQEITEEQIWEEVENWVNSLLEEGYDLSDHTWEEMYKSYIEEVWGTNQIMKNQQQQQKAQATGAKKALETGKYVGISQGGALGLQSGVKAKLDSAATKAQGRTVLSTQTPKTIFGQPMFKGPKETKIGGQRMFAAKLGGKDVYVSAKKPAAPVPPKDDNPADDKNKNRPAAAPDKSKIAPSKPTGSSMDQWAKANPKLAAAAAERARTRGTSATTNPQMADLKSRLPAPTPPVKAATPSQAVAAAPKPSAAASGSLAPATASIAAKPSSAMSQDAIRRGRLNMEMEYDAYDLVLEYLIDNGHAETVDEAHYIMLEMDAQMVGDIVEETLQEKLKPGTRGKISFGTGKDAKFNQAMTEKNPRTGRQRATSPELKAMGAHGRAKSAQYDAERRGDTEAARKHETRRGKIAHTVYRKTGRIIDRADND